MRKDRCYLVGIESRKRDGIEIYEDGLLVLVHPATLEAAQNSLTQDVDFVSPNGKIYKLVEMGK